MKKLRKTGYFWQMSTLFLHCSSYTHSSKYYQLMSYFYRYYQCPLLFAQELRFY